MRTRIVFRLIIQLGLIRFKLMIRSVDLEFSLMDFCCDKSKKVLISFMYTMIKRYRNIL